MVNLTTKSIWSARCSRVIDGDTVQLSISLPCGVLLGGMTARLAGIETYEICPQHKWQGEAAKVALQSLVTSQPLLVVSHRDKPDRYGRLLVWLYYWDGVQHVSAQHKMVEQGQAWWWWPRGDKTAGKPMPEVLC